MDRKPACPRHPGAPVVTPPTVLHVITSLGGGGAERVMLTVIAGLPDVRHHLAVGDRGVLLPHVPESVPIHNARLGNAVSELIARLKPEVIHTWHDESLLTAIVP